MEMNDFTRKLAYVASRPALAPLQLKKDTQLILTFQRYSFRKATGESYRRTVHVDLQQAICTWIRRSPNAETPGTVKNPSASVAPTRAWYCRFFHVTHCATLIFAPTSAVPKHICYRRWWISRMADKILSRCSYSLGIAEGNAV